jgi:hypothetical protein
MSDTPQRGPGRPRRYQSREFLLWPRNLAYLRREAKARQLSENEFARLVFDHAESCSFFGNRTNATLAPEQGE